MEGRFAMTVGIGLTPALVFGIAFEGALLGITGVLHLVRPEHLARAAARHHTAGAIPNWLGQLERPVLVGVVECATALAVAASVFAGRAWVVAAVQVVVGLFALSLISFVSVLRRSPATLPCGCHPFAGDVQNATFLPATALAVTAIAVGVGVWFGGGAVALITIPPTVTLGALTAGVVLVYAGAATSSDPNAGSERGATRRRPVKV
jgi:hypothetical protein